MLDRICKELGVKIGKKWIGNDGKTYIIEENASLWEYTSIGLFTDSIKRVLIGELKPVWKPEEGERYYTPYIGYNSHEVLYGSCMWEGSEGEEWFLYNNLVFKTKEEAIEAANRIIELYKEEYK